MKKYMLLRIFIILLCSNAFLNGNAQTRDQIDFKNISVTAAEGRVNIKWTTDAVASTNYFELEKSNDGQHFKTVALILGADPSIAAGNRFGGFDKVTAKTKKSFYRIKHIDKNGDVQLSEIQMLAIK